MAKLNEKAAREYAELRKIALEDGASLGDIAGAIEEEVLKRWEKTTGLDRDKDKGKTIHCDSCNAVILDEDTFCWNCGGDVSTDGGGGLEAYLQAKSGGGNQMEIFGGPEAGGKETAEESPEESAEEGPDSDDLSEAPKPPGRKAKATEKDTPKKKGKKAKAAEEEPTQDLSPSGPSLKQRVDRIKELSSSTGLSAWEIGKELFEIQEGKLYRQGGHKDFRTFCESELGYSYRTAYAFISISQRFEQSQVRFLDSTKLFLLANKSLPPAALPKLLKAATPEPEGGKGLTDRELAGEIKEAVSASRAKAGKKETRGRPRKSVFAGLVGRTFKVAVEDGGGSLVDQGVRMDVTVLKNAVKVEFALDK